MQIDNRKQPRHSREEVIYIEVLSSTAESKDDNLILECTTKDISQDGLKISSEFSFMVDSILELLISFESGGYKFLLTGQVKWCEEVDNNKYLAGFELIESEHSDYAVWRNMFSGLEG